MVLAVAAVTFAAFALVVPFPHTAGFWVAFAAGIIAFALQIPLFKAAFRNAADLKSKFLGLPVIKVGFLYLGIQIIVSLAIFTLGFIPEFPAWLAVLACLIVLCGALICSITASGAREQIQSMEEKNAQNTAFIQNLRLTAQNLSDTVNDSALKNELQSLADNLRFSDPVSSIAISEQDNALMSGFELLKHTVHSGDIEQAVIQCKTVQNLLKVRNEACKRMKRG